MSDYLLLKITVLEHASAADNCRVGEDILTVICDEFSTPSPSVTPTQTPTPTPTSIGNNFINSLTIPPGINYISGDGLTFAGSNGDILSYTSQIGSDLPSTMNISISGTIRSSVVFPNGIYFNKPFRFTLSSNNTNYTGNFTAGTVNFS